MNHGENIESGIDDQIQDEATRLLKEIELMTKQVDKSALYNELRYELESNETIHQHFVRILGSHSRVQMVIYALGSMEYTFPAQFQLALALLLKRDFSNLIGDIEVYDPAMSPADIIVLKELGCEVLTIDENCMRQVQRPTMFYMPHPNYNLIGNLLRANWSSSRINQIFLLTNKFSDALSTITPCVFHEETLQRLERIRNFTTEIDIITSYHQIYANVFSRFAWHFFDVDPNIDMETSLPVTAITEYERDDREGPSWLEKQRTLERNFLGYINRNLTSQELSRIFGVYRGPRRIRCSLVPPPLGWIKLSIYGIGSEGDQPGCFSGIFYTDSGTRIQRFSGIIYHIPDSVVVGLEALRYGLSKCLEGTPITQKLIVESNDFMLVQFANGRLAPHAKALDWLNRISIYQEIIPCAIYHVYEEATAEAKEFAQIAADRYRT